MFIISTSTSYSKSVLKSFNTYAEAESYAKNNMNAECFAEDDDYADCADFLAAGEIYSIEPECFSAAA